MARIGVYLIVMAIMYITILGLFSLYLYPQMQKPGQPLQPVSGPGGSDYNYGNVTVNSFGVGEDQYWIFEPSSPKPSSAPVIVFLHGWGITTPAVYRAWINHLVRDGNIVIYPRYQKDLSTPSDHFTPNSIRAVKEAIEQLQTGDHVKPQLNNFAIVGHSAGGLLSVNMAALASSQGIPQPKAVFAVEPGKSRSSADTTGPILENLSKIPSDTLLLTMAGDKDNWVGQEDAINIIKETTNVPLHNKDFILMRSDYNGYPPVVADHLAPLAFEVPVAKNNISLFVDAADYYGTWKLFDGLYQTAFYDNNTEYALGNTSQQRYMGLWSDNKPVNQLFITNNP
jgi:acetyl esterase/lipase